MVETLASILLIALGCGAAYSAYLELTAMDLDPLLNPLPPSKAAAAGLAVIAVCLWVAGGIGLL